MKTAGLRRLTSGLGWTRDSAAGQLIVWFQVNKWGWNDRWGSNFTLEFQLAPPGALPMSGHGRRERIGYLLEGFAELDELRQRNNAIIARLPGTLAGEVPLQNGFTADPEPAVYGRDLWLNYYAIDDARSWAAYLTEKLPRFLSLFENETRSEAGQASARFHRALGRMQNTRVIEAKAAILEEYVRTEKDPHYRAAAKHWLAQLPGKKGN